MSSVYFTDRDLGNLLPNILRNAGMKVERHADHFAHDTPDTDWLQAAGRNGWYVLTHNRRIRYTPNELEAVMTHGVGMFVLIGQATHQELAANVVRTATRIERFIKRHARPFIAKVYRPSAQSRPTTPPPGRVEMWLSAREWRTGR